MIALDGVITMLRHFKTLWNDRCGNIAIMAGIVAVPIMMAAGVALDYAVMRQQSSMLQIAADAAALASVRACFESS